MAVAIRPRGGDAMPLTPESGARRDSRTWPPLDTGALVHRSRSALTGVVARGVTNRAPAGSVVGAQCLTSNLAGSLKQRTNQ
jgi:hypothetical protein